MKKRFRLKYTFECRPEGYSKEDLGPDPSAGIGLTDNLLVGSEVKDLAGGSSYQHFLIAPPEMEESEIVLNIFRSWVALGSSMAVDEKLHENLRGICGISVYLYQMMLLSVGNKALGVPLKEICDDFETKLVNLRKVHASEPVSEVRH